MDVFTARQMSAKTSEKTFLSNSYSKVKTQTPSCKYDSLEHHKVRLCHNRTTGGHFIALDLITLARSLQHKKVEICFFSNPARPCRSYS